MKGYRTNNGCKMAEGLGADAWSKSRLQAASGRSPGVIEEADSDPAHRFKAVVAAAPHSGMAPAPRRGVRPPP